MKETTKKLIQAADVMGHSSQRTENTIHGSNKKYTNTKNVTKLMTRNRTV
jgi:hypothetical protein